MYIFKCITQKLKKLKFCPYLLFLAICYNPTEFFCDLTKKTGNLMTK